MQCAMFQPTSDDLPCFLTNRGTGKRLVHNKNNVWVIYIFVIDILYYMFKFTGKVNLFKVYCWSENYLPWI